MKRRVKDPALNQTDYKNDLFAGLIQAHLEATTEDWKDAGLGTMSFLAHDVVHAPHLARGGLLTLAEPVLDHGALGHQASPERTHWWHERLRRCFALLES